MEKKIIVNNTALAYEAYGNPEKMPLILIHGFPFCKRMWSQQVPVLMDHCHIIIYDVRGHGNSSSGDAKFSMDLFADDLIALMDALHIEKAVIGGLSMGGYILLAALEKHRKRIAGVILADTKCTEDSADKKSERLKQVEAVRKNGVEKFAEENVKNLFAPQPFFRKERTELVKSWIIENGEHTICSALQALAERKETCDVLHKISVPALIIVGAEDKITPPSDAMMLHHGIKGAQLEIIEEAGHLSNLEQPEQFNELLLSFMKRFEKTK